MELVMFSRLHVASFLAVLIAMPVFSFAGSPMPDVGASFDRITSSASAAPAIKSPRYTPIQSNGFWCGIPGVRGGRTFCDSGDNCCAYRQQAYCCGRNTSCDGKGGCESYGGYVPR
jgi:hypothetical protein